MSPSKNIRINLTEYDLANGGKGKLAILMYIGNGDPKINLDLAVEQFVGEESHSELISSSLDNPWMRVIVSDINGISQAPFDPNIHHLP